MNILIVDDEADMLAELSLTLRRLKFRCIEARSGEEALERIDQHGDSIDLMLTDVRMPGMDGLSLLRELQRRESSLLCAVMSGHTDSNMVIEALALQAFDFLPKPFTVSMLQDLLQRATALKDAASSTTEETAPGEDGLLYQQSFPSSRNWIAVTCQQILASCRPHCSDSSLSDLRLATTEALVNAVVHGNLEVSSEAKREDDWDRFEAEVLKQEQNAEFSQRQVKISAYKHENSISIEVQDEGRGFDISQVAEETDPYELMNCGRGLLLIRYSTDEVSWNDQGNRIRFCKHLS